MLTGEKGLALIKKYEGFVAKPYLCPAKVWTIGYGSTYYPDGKKVQPTDKPITTAKGEALLKQVVREFETAVAQMATMPLNQNQFDALVSFCYNVGKRNLRNSTLLKLVNKNPNDKNIAAQFLLWNKANGKPLAGLTKRRKEEAALYFI